jgi:hypothetical protein
MSVLADPALELIFHRVGKGGLEGSGQNHVICWSGLGSLRPAW